MFIIILLYCHHIIIVICPWVYLGLFFFVYVSAADFSWDYLPKKRFFLFWEFWFFRDSFYDYSSVFDSSAERFLQRAFQNSSKYSLALFRIWLVNSFQSDFLSRYWQKLRKESYSSPRKMHFINYHQRLEITF